jgi:hypothetical protein
MIMIGEESGGPTGKWAGARHLVRSTAPDPVLQGTGGTGVAATPKAGILSGVLPPRRMYSPDPGKFFSSRHGRRKTFGSNGVNGRVPDRIGAAHLPFDGGAELQPASANLKSAG